jgi:hypothetical protein
LNWLDKFSGVIEIVYYVFAGIILLVDGWIWLALARGNDAKAAFIFPLVTCASSSGYVKLFRLAAKNVD